MSSQDQPFSLHAGINAAELREAFERNGWVQIAPFLADAAAERLRQQVADRHDWTVAFQIDDKPQVEFDQQRWNALSRGQREAVHKLAAPTQESGFRYLFEQIVAVGNDLTEREPETLLGQFARFLSSDDVLELIRQVTGCEDVSRADARATRYGPGHFLSIHSDEVAGLGRRLAYVFGVTPSWRAEWGGLLMFHDDGGDVTHALVPRMNALNLFKVPRRHSVSLVAPFAPLPRYSITGWLRSSTG
ncbi:MAG: 2OG-Fe(II) oxygenase [Sphingomicrobium sp.]